MSNELKTYTPDLNGYAQNMKDLAQSARDSGDYPLDHLCSYAARTAAEFSLNATNAEQTEIAHLREKLEQLRKELEDTSGLLKDCRHVINAVGMIMTEDRNNAAKKVDRINDLMKMHMNRIFERVEVKLNKQSGE